MAKTVCDCDIPTPYESNKGEKTNRCRACGGLITDYIKDVTMTALGQLILRYEKVLLGDLELDNDHPFIRHIVNTCEKDLKQKKLIWDNNQEVNRRQEAST